MFTHFLKKYAIINIIGKHESVTKTVLVYVNMAILVLCRVILKLLMLKL